MRRWEHDGDYYPFFGGPLCGRCMRHHDDHALAPWPGPGLVCPPEVIAAMREDREREMLMRSPKHLIRQAREALDVALALL